IKACSAFNRQRTFPDSSSTCTSLTFKSALIGAGPMGGSTSRARVLVYRVAPITTTNTTTAARMTWASRRMGSAISVPDYHSVTGAAAKREDFERRLDDLGAQDVVHVDDSMGPPGLIQHDQTGDGTCLLHDVEGLSGQRFRGDR